MGNPFKILEIGQSSRGDIHIRLQHLPKDILQIPKKKYNRMIKHAFNTVCIFEDIQIVFDISSRHYSKWFVMTTPPQGFEITDDNIKAQILEACIAQFQLMGIYIDNIKKSMGESAVKKLFEDHFNMMDNG